MWRVFSASTCLRPSRRWCFRGPAVRIRRHDLPRSAAREACAWICARGCSFGAGISSSTESGSSRPGVCGRGLHVSPTTGPCRRTGAFRRHSCGRCTAGILREGFAPETAMSETPADAASERILLAAKNDYLQGFNRLLGLARRELRIFDPDLSELDMNSTRRIETLTRFLRESRTRRIYVALHDIEHVTKHCPRLIALMSGYTSALLIFQTQGEAAKVQDC